MKNFGKESKLGMPFQAAPVERQICGAAIHGDAGIDASGFFDTLKSIAGTVLPIAAKAAPFALALL